MFEDKNRNTANERPKDVNDAELSDESLPEVEADESGPSPDSQHPADVTDEQQFEARVQELQDKLLRTAAEFDNYRKRVARQYDEMVQSANDKILLDLVGIADNLERALQHADKDTDTESLRQGVQLIHSQVIGLLEKYNVKPIEALGKPFDPNFHDALMQVDSEEQDEGIVALEVGKGYHRGDKVLRHTKVGVSKKRKSK